MMHEPNTQPNRLPFRIERPDQANKLIDLLTEENGFPLVSLSGASGIGKTDLIAGCAIEQVFEERHGKTPLRAFLTIETGDSPIELTEEIADTIVEYHPDLATHKIANAFRSKVKRWVRKNPEKAIDRILSLLAASEQADSEHELEQIKLIICLDQFDKLFESQEGDLPQLQSLLEFLSGFVGMKSILFVINYRDWALPKMEQLFDSHTSSLHRLHFELPTPDGYDAKAITTQWLEQAQIEDIYLSKAVRDLAGNQPKSLALLANFFQQRHPKSEINEFNLNLADHHYDTLGKDEKIHIQDLFKQLTNNDGQHHVDIEASQSRHHIKAGLALTSFGFLHVTSAKNNQLTFTACNPDWLKLWQYPFNTHKASSIENRFAAQALRWDNANRNSETLLDAHLDLDAARSLLKKPKKVALLATLTREFLEQSIKIDDENVVTAKVSTAPPEKTNTPIIAKATENKEIEEDREEQPIAPPLYQDLMIPSILAILFLAIVIITIKDKILPQPTLASKQHLTDQAKIDQPKKLDKASSIKAIDSDPNQIQALEKADTDHSYELDSVHQLEADIAPMAPQIESSTPDELAKAIPAVSDSANLTPTIPSKADLQAELEKFFSDPTVPQEYKNLVYGADRFDTPYNLSFASNSSSLDSQSSLFLEILKTFLKHPGNENLDTILIGFSDSIGSSGNNRKVSGWRAESVAKLLRESEITNITAVGLGEVAPIGDNDTELGREKNRRVEIWIRR